MSLRLAFAVVQLVAGALLWWWIARKRATDADFARRLTPVLAVSVAVTAVVLVATEVGGLVAGWAVLAAFGVVCLVVAFSRRPR